MYISQLEYFVLVALGARSMIQILRAFCIKLVSVLQDAGDGDGSDDTGDWSVVGKEEKSNESSEQHSKDEQSQKHGPNDDWWALGATISDARVKDIITSFGIVMNDYRKVAADLLWGPSTGIRKAFWPVLAVAFIASTLSIFRDVGYRHLFMSPCQRIESQSLAYTKAYEALTDNGDVYRYWREHPYYVNTPYFVFRYLAIQVACVACWYQVMTRVSRNEKITDLDSFFRALRNEKIKDLGSFFYALWDDRQLCLYFVWALLSTVLWYFMLFHIYVETESPFKTLRIGPSATPLEIKQAYRNLIWTTRKPQSYEIPIELPRWWWWSY